MINPEELIFSPVIITTWVIVKLFQPLNTVQDTTLASAWSAGLEDVSGDKAAGADETSGEVVSDRIVIGADVQQRIGG